MTTITPATCRAARGLVDWTQRQLAEAARVGLSTVKGFEGGTSAPMGNNLRAIQEALENAGIVFIPEDGGGAGVRMKEPARGGEHTSRRTLIAFALLLPMAAGAQTGTPPASPPQGCLSPTEMAALLPASREQAEDWCEAGDARALERVRAVLRLLGKPHPAGDAPPTPVHQEGERGRGVTAPVLDPAGTRL